MQQETAKTLLDALNARDGIVAVVGAGGKKSTLYRLFEAHHALGTKRILITSTVQIAASAQSPDVPTVIVDDEDNADDAIAETRGRDGTWLIAGPSTKPGRFSGLPEHLIPKIHREGGFDISLVKADGARMRMIKAPAEAEPALPDDVTTILPVVSARVFGRPLTEKLVHRPERLIEVTDAEPGSELTPLHVAKLLSSPNGALKKTGSARIVPVINMVDSPERRELASEAAKMALSMTERFDRVALASMMASSPLIDVIAR